MSHLFWLEHVHVHVHVKRIQHLFPKPRGVARVDDRKVLSGIIHVIRNGLRWRDAPPEYGSNKTLYNRWARWSRMGVFARILSELAAEGDATGTLMIDATHLKAHRTACSMGLKEKGRGRLIGRTKGGLNSKLHAVTDAMGRPVRLFFVSGKCQRLHWGEGTSCISACCQMDARGSRLRCRLVPRRIERKGH